MCLFVCIYKNKFVFGGFFGQNGLCGVCVYITADFLLFAVH